MKLIVAAAAVKHGMPVKLALKQIEAESNWRPDALSPAGAVGLGQLMPATARSLGVKNPRDPRQNADASMRYMAQLRQRFGSHRTALIAYNWGEGNVKRKGIAKLPIETRRYLAKILGEK